MATLTVPTVRPIIVTVSATSQPPGDIHWPSGNPLATVANGDTVIYAYVTRIIISHNGNDESGNPVAIP
jgi:hypothetical protein